MITVVVAVDPEFESGVVARLASCPDIEVVSRPADESELVAKAGAGAGQVFVVSRYFPGLDADIVVRLLHHGAHVLALGDPADLAEWGVPSVDLLADATELAAAVRGCAATVQLPPRPRHSPLPQPAQGKVLAVWGTGGAPGRSTIAAGLAHVAARRGETLLVDADTVGANQAVLLGVLDDSPQLAALCRAAASGHLGAAAVREQRSAITRGLHLITGMSRAERWAEIGPAVLSQVLTELRRHAATIVVDVAWRTDPDDEYADPHYDRHAATRAALECADHVLVVANADPPGLLRLINLMTAPAFAQLADRATVVVNKLRPAAVGPDPESRVRDVLSRFAGETRLRFLPDARTDLDAAVLAGRAVTESAPRSPLALALGALADGLEIMAPEPARRPRTRRAGRAGRHGGAGRTGRDGTAGRVR